jgi:signal transduction histidine kinase
MSIQGVNYPIFEIGFMRILEYFSSQQKPLSEIELPTRTETVQIKFIFISILFSVGYFANSFLTGFLMARYVMILAIVLFIIQLFAHKLGWISLRTSSHIFIVICWLLIVLLSISSDGIHSFVLPWVSLIPILGLVLVNARVAWIWSAVVSVTVVACVFIEPRDFIPPHLFMVNNNLLTASLHIGLVFLILTLTYFFDLQQNTLIKKIESQNDHLKYTQNELATQNEELIQSQKEIFSQRDLVAKQNENLEQARQIIEIQHQTLIEKNEGLEQEVQNRTKELVDYNHQLEQFAFISSHNLRTPIARILGLGNLLELQHTKEDELTIQKNLIHSARELDRVVKDLTAILDVRKSSNSIISEIDIREEIDLILLNLEKDILETNASIQVEVEHMPKLRTVKPYFDSIIMNLISNAIKYRKVDAKPLIHVSVAQQNNFICFTIKDNGLGIDLSTSSKKLFTLYSRFHDHVDGKGLGLYMVKTQVESLGGKIEVESEVNVGTTFRVFVRPS